MRAVRLEGLARMAKDENHEGPEERLAEVQLELARLRAENERLIRDHDRVRILLDRARDVILLHDGKGNVIDFNDAANESLGYSRDEMLSMNIRDFNPQVAAIPMDRLGQGWAEMQLNRYIEVEGEHQHRDGGLIPIEIVVMPFLLQGERFYVATARDLFERRKIEAERAAMLTRLEERVAERTEQLLGANHDLRREIEVRTRQEAELIEAKSEADGANLAKSQFLAGMSHELRTPLNVIIGYSEMLFEDLDDGSDHEADAGRIRGAGKHLLGIINNVLDLSKIEAGKVKLFLERIDIPELLDEMVATVQPLVDQNGNRLRLDLQGDLPAMRTDRTRVRQILFNLISNACKFTENGEVLLYAGEQKVNGKPGLRFTITDTGIGMSEEELSRLFQPFVQADASTTRRYGGTGLGLALCTRFADLLGGKITVESEEGRGSIFLVDLPLVAPRSSEPLLSSARKD